MKNKFVKLFRELFQEYLENRDIRYLETNLKYLESVYKKQSGDDTTMYLRLGKDITIIHSVPEILKDLKSPNREYTIELIESVVNGEAEIKIQ